MNTAKSLIAFLIFAGLLIAQTHSAAEHLPKPPCKAKVTLLRGDNGKPVWLTSLQMVDQATHCEAPAYPGMFEGHIQGTVVLSLLVDEKGEVSCIKVVSGIPLLLSAAVDAAQKWKFKPRAHLGKPAGFYGWLEFQFSTNAPDPSRNSCLQSHHW